MPKKKKPKNEIIGYIEEPEIFNNDISTETKEDTEDNCYYTLLGKWLYRKAGIIKRKYDEVLKAIPNNVPYPIVANLFTENNNRKTNNYKWDNDHIEYAFRLYMRLIAEINMTSVLVPSRENFCFFVNWNAKTYEMLFNSEDEATSACMTMVEDYIIDCQLSMGQTGVTRSSIAKFRTQIAGEHGNALVTQKEVQNVNKNNVKTKSMEQIAKELENLKIK